MKNSILVFIFSSFSGIALAEQCYAIRDADQRNFCEGKCYAIRDYDLRRTCEANTEVSTDNEQRGQT